MITLDPKKVEPATMKLSQIVRDHLAQQPPKADHVFEILNALAVTTAMVLAGTVKDGVDSGATDFFQSALDNQLIQIGARPILNFAPKPKGH